MGKLQYRTKQMTELLTFLESVKGRHVTVKKICDALAQKGIAIGTTGGGRYGREVCGRWNQQCLL